VGDAFFNEMTKKKVIEKFHPAVLKYPDPRPPSYQIRLTPLDIRYVMHSFAASLRSHACTPYYSPIFDQLNAVLSNAITAIIE